MTDFNYNAEKAKASAARRALVQKADSDLRVRTEAARVELERSTRERQQQLDQWLEAQVAALRRQVDATLRAEYPGAYLTYDTAIEGAADLHRMDMEAAQAAMADFEAQAQARRAAKQQEKWAASEAGKKARQAQEERQRAEAAQFERDTRRGCWSSLYCRWSAQEEIRLGVDPATALALYERTRDAREAYLQVWPDHRAALESPDRAGWDALEAAARAREAAP